MAKILIIDDDHDMRDIYEEVLKDGGYTVETAPDGEMGLAKIIQGGYDLILLDIMMPKIDGIAVLKKLKEKPPTSYNGPIIVLSQLNEDKIKQTAMEEGAKGYIVKSDQDPDQILAKISQLLQAK